MLFEEGSRSGSADKGVRASHPSAVRVAPQDPAQAIGRQVLKSGMSPGAHYREARRARSSAEYISKMEGGLQELEETCYWLELLIESDIMPEKRLSGLHKEAEELIAIFASCAIKAKKSK